MSDPICLILEYGTVVSSPQHKKPRSPLCSLTINLQIQPEHASNSISYTLPSFLQSRTLITSFSQKFTKLHRHSSFTLSYSLCFFIVSVHLSLWGSAAGMRLGIYLADPVMIHIGIDLRCGNIRMSQHFLYTF